VTDPLWPVRRRLAAADERWQRLPLRAKLTASAALAATLAIVAVTGVAFVAVRHELRTQIDDQLRRQAHEVQLRHQVDAFGLPQALVVTVPGDYRSWWQVVAQDGTISATGAKLPVIPADLHIARVGSGVRLRDATYRDRHVRVLTEPVPGARGFAVQIAVPLTAVDRQLHTLAAAFALIALAGLGFTVVVARGAVRRVMRPVAELTAATERIAATRDLSVRIVAPGGDELGRLARTFNTMVAALQRSLDAQRQLVLDASHELRTPLASLRTNVEVLADVDRLPPEDRRELLDGVVTQLDELTGLVADVVELARGDAPPGERQDIALDELVSRGVDRARRHWPQVVFDAQVEPVSVSGVANRLDRAVANMLDNAGKFSPPGGTVEVRLSADGTLTVADRGPGVPDDALPHVFDRFFRADEARALPGSGLGLAIVHQVAEGHGGSIRLTNREGGGAVATLRLPVAAEPGPDGADATGAPATPPAPKEPARAHVPMPVEESLFR
jgi:two-component system sensor histidine kinase MprB